MVSRQQKSANAVTPHLEFLARPLLSVEQGFPVVQEGKVLGVISVRHLDDIPDEQRRSTTVEAVMQPINDEMTITPETALSEALKRMNQGATNHLLIMRNDTLQGMITKSGLLRFLEIKQILDG